MEKRENLGYTKPTRPGFPEFWRTNSLQTGHSSFFFGMPGLKRSAAPSTVFNKKIKVDEGVAVKAEKPKENLMNHLDLFNPKKQVEEQPDKENEEDIVCKEDGIVVKKNYVLNSANSSEVCFAVHYTAANKGAKKDVDGKGILVIGYVDCRLFNSDGREIVTLQITREPKKTDYEDHHQGDKQKVLICHGSKKPKATYFFSGNTLKVGSKFAKVRHLLIIRSHARSCTR